MTCRACGFDHPLMRCEVAKRIATNAAKKDATNNDATNGIRSDDGMAGGSPGLSVAAGTGNPDEHEDRNERSKAANTGSPNSGIAVVPDKTANRRTREAYNAYQKEYMRRKRAKLRPDVVTDAKA